MVTIVVLPLEMPGCIRQVLAATERFGSIVSPGPAECHWVRGRRFLAALGVPLRSATLEEMRKAFDAISVREDGSPAAGSTAAAQIATVKSLLSFGARVRYLQVNLGELFKLKAVPAD